MPRRHNLREHSLWPDAVGPFERSLRRPRLSAAKRPGWGRTIPQFAIGRARAGSGLGPAEWPTAAQSGLPAAVLTGTAIATCSAPKKGQRGRHHLRSAVLRRIIVSTNARLPAGTRGRQGGTSSRTGGDAQELCPALSRAAAMSMGEAASNRNSPGGFCGRAPTPSAATAGRNGRLGSFRSLSHAPLRATFAVSPLAIGRVAASSVATGTTASRCLIGTPNSTDPCGSGVQIRQPARVHLGGRRRGCAAGDF
jgi:hypothetical protein